MIRFEYDINPEYDGHKYKTILETSEDTSICEMISAFTRFLKSIGFHEPIITQAYQEEIDDIKMNVKENYIMMKDDEEES